MPLCFGEAPVGTAFVSGSRRIVKVTNQYFNIRPHSDGRSRMVNAIYEDTGEL